MCHVSCESSVRPRLVTDSFSGVGVLFNVTVKYACTPRYVEQMIDDLCGFMLTLHLLFRSSIWSV